MRVYIVHSSDCIGVLGVYADSEQAVKDATGIVNSSKLTGRNFESVDPGPFFVAKWRDKGVELFVESRHVIVDTATTAGEGGDESLSDR